MSKLNFKEQNPLQNLSKAEPDNNRPITSPRKRVGRPVIKNVKETCRNINVAVPTELLDKWEQIKIVHGSNLTGYVTKLIQKDMDANYEHYRELTEGLKGI